MSNIKLFESKQIRTVWNEADKKWYFVVGLKSQNLRDHMTDLELIFSMLGEASTTKIVKTQYPEGFIQNKKVAKQGGAVAGYAIRELESRTGKKVVSTDNYFQEAKKNKELKKGKEEK